MNDSNETIDLSQQSEVNIGMSGVSEIREVDDDSVSRILNQVSETIGVLNFSPTFSGENVLEDLIDWFEEYE